MAPNDLPVDLLMQLRSTELRRYALATGWQRNEAVNGRVAVFQHPASELDQLVVPVEGSDLDAYAVLAGEAIRKLAGWEKRSATEVLNDLLLPPADVLRFRTVSPEAAGGSLPLEQTVQMVTGVRRLLSATAHSALTPQRYFTRMRRTEAEEFVGRCQFGQTERGSFTFAVACPLDLPTPGTLLFENPPTVVPFPRRVTELLMQTLAELAQAADLSQLNRLTDSAHPGLSANFCEALLLLRPSGDRSYLGVSSSWSRVLPPSESLLRRRAAVELRQETFEAAEYLASRFRSTPKPRAGRYIGFVDALRGVPSPSDPGPSGEVHLSIVEGDDFIRARAYLSADDYATAGAAHLANELISCRGILHRLPRLSQIDSVTDFHVLEAEEEAEPAR